MSYVQSAELRIYSIPSHAGTHEKPFGKTKTKTKTSDPKTKITDPEETIIEHYHNVTYQA